MTPISPQRFHGRNSRVWIAPTNTSQAVPVSYGAAWTIDAATDRADATAWGDRNKTALAGLPAAKGTMSGMSDLAGDVIITCAIDGLDRRTYFYKDYVNNPGEYYYTTATWDGSITTGVNDVGKITGNWNATADLIEHLPS